MTFDDYVAKIEKYEAIEEHPGEYFSFSEENLETVRRNPDDFIEYLIFLCTRSLSADDKKRLNDYLMDYLVFDDDDEEKEEGM